MPRLFTGLEVPREVGLALSLKRGGLFGARWIDPENYHITLRFIGDVDHHTASEVTDMLDRLIGSEAFTLKLDHLGSFGGDRPRALFAGWRTTRHLFACRPRTNGCCSAADWRRRAGNSCRT